MQPPQHKYLTLEHRRPLSFAHRDAEFPKAALRIRGSENHLAGLLPPKLVACGPTPLAITTSSKHSKADYGLKTPVGGLREQGAIAEVSPPTGHIADELRRYDECVRNARGLSAGTRRQ